MSKRVLAVILSVLMLATLFAACSNTAQPSATPTATPEPTAAPSVEPTPEEWQTPLSADDPVTFTFLWPLANYPVNSLDTRLGKEVYNRVGVAFEYILTTGDANEYHNLLVASRDFPDVVTIGQGAQVQLYMDANCLLPVEEMLQENAPYVYEMWTSERNNNLVQRWKTMSGTDTLYFWGNSMDIDREGQGPVLDFLSPDLVLEELPDFGSYFLFPEITTITNEVPQNMSDMYEIYKAYQQKYGNDGVHYATAIHAGYGITMAKYGAVINGYKAYNDPLVISPDGNIELPILLDCVKEYLLFQNKLYREGLMDPESPLGTQEDCLTKFSSGSILSYGGNWWMAHNANMTMANTDSMKDNTYIPVQVKADGYEGSIYQSNLAKVGWRMVALTEDCEKPEKFIQYMEWYYRDPEAQLLLNWGFEGEDYIINADGEPDMNAELNASHTGDYYKYDLGLSAIGPAPLYWCFWPVPSRTVQGYAPRHVLADFNQSGAVSDLYQAVESAGWGWNTQTRGQWYADPTLLGVKFDADQLNKWTLANATLDDGIMNMIMAPTEAEAISQYYAIVASMDANGALEYVDYMNNLYHEYAAQ